MINFHTVLEVSSSERQEFHAQNLNISSKNHVNWWITTRSLLYDKINSLHKVRTSKRFFMKEITLLVVHTHTHNKLIKQDLAKTKNELQPQLNIRNSNISPLPSVFVCHYLLYFLCLQIATFFFIIPWVIFLYCTKQKQNWLSQLYRQYGKIINIRFY